MILASYTDISIIFALVTENFCLITECSLHCMCFFFFSSRRRHTRFDCDWSSDVCSSDLQQTLRNLDLGQRGLETDRPWPAPPGLLSSWVFSYHSKGATHMKSRWKIGLVEIGRASCRERV